MPLIIGHNDAFHAFHREYVFCGFDFVIIGSVPTNSDEHKPKSGVARLGYLGEEEALPAAVDLERGPGQDHLLSQQRVDCGRDGRWSGEGAAATPTPDPSAQE